MEEISEKLDMSESRVSQLHSNVIPRLKNKIERNPIFFENKEIYAEESKNNDPLY